MTSFVSGSGLGTGTGTGTGNEIPILFLMYNDITARSANIQAGMGVALALFFVFCLSISGPLGLRTQNNLMCTIEYDYIECLVFVHFASTLPCSITSTDEFLRDARSMSSCAAPWLRRFDIIHDSPDRAAFE
jgi:hypothetical protein